MANEDHVRKLLEGVESWNAWRAEDPRLRPDLTRIAFTEKTCRETVLWNHERGLVDLRGMDFSGCELAFSRWESVAAQTIRLGGADLRGANLVQVNLSETSAPRAVFSSASLSRTDLTGADLRDTVFNGALVEQSTLVRSDFTDANMVGATLRRCVCDAAIFAGAQLVRAEMDHLMMGSANCTGADIRETRILHCTGRSADLSGADLAASSMEHCVFSGARLEGCNLRGTGIRETSLRRARLSRSVLRAAWLRRVDLRGADLTSTNLAAVRYDRWGRYQGIQMNGCYGSPRFERFAKDQEYIEEVRGERHDLRYWLVYLPWLVSSDCGRSLLLWSGWSMLFAIGFGLMFWRLGPEHFQLTHLDFSFSTMLYYSCVTFTTLGFGDVIPRTSTGAWWVMAEVMVGYMMLGGLVAIFSNKLARRS